MLIIIIIWIEDMKSVFVSLLYIRWKETHICLIDKGLKQAPVLANTCSKKCGVDRTGVSQSLPLAERLFLPPLFTITISHAIGYRKAEKHQHAQEENSTTTTSDFIHSNNVLRCIQFDAKALPL